MTRNDPHIILIGGASGVGKSTVARKLAQGFDVDVAALDDVFQAVLRLSTPAHLPHIHRCVSISREDPPAAEEILHLFLAAAREFAPAVEAVIDTRFDECPPVLIEGDWLLPDTIMRWKKAHPGLAAQVSAVFLLEADASQLRRNFVARQPAADAESTNLRAKVSGLHSMWLSSECDRTGCVAVAARPWDTVAARVRAALEAAGDSSGVAD